MNLFHTLYVVYSLVVAKTRAAKCGSTRALNSWRYPVTYHFLISFIELRCVALQKTRSTHSRVHTVV